MKKYILSILCAMTCVLSLFAQRKSVEVTGTIVDAEVKSDRPR